MPHKTFRNNSIKRHTGPMSITHLASLDTADLFSTLHTSVSGLTTEQSEIAQKKYGFNEIAVKKRKSWALRLWLIILNPLVIILLFLAAVSYLTSDSSSSFIILIMVAISVLIRFFQENQAAVAAEKLQSMVKTTCAVLRDGKKVELTLRLTVPGDIIYLSAGDIIPADVRLIKSKELFANESTLTGETMPAEKHSSFVPDKQSKNPLEFQNLCFMGTYVENGTAIAVVLKTGRDTYFGQLAEQVAAQQTITNFDKGIKKFTWLMIGFIAVMAPIIFFINWLGKGDWWNAFLFSISIAVGLTPEMLPTIVAVNLTKGAIVMAKKKVIIKKIEAIQNFGAMDILCTDKTGTLTQNKIVLVKNVDINGKQDASVLQYAYANSSFQTGFKNLLDDAILNFAKQHNGSFAARKYAKLDELPFDFVRRRMSVIVEDEHGHHVLLCKGAIEEVSENCSEVHLNGRAHSMREEDRKKIADLNNSLSKEGYRVIAVAYKFLSPKRGEYTVKDEQEMVFAGCMAFFDPPKETAAGAISALMHYGIGIKVLTGDNELVTQKICKEVNLPVDKMLLGNAIENMSEADLDFAVENTTIFAKLAPHHKMRVVKSLQRKGHVVGFLGDGINDAAGLKAADVGISVDTAVDIAKESADIVLLEFSLMVLKEGVVEGRKIFGNIMKYLRMGASSNFGNMLSVVGASVFLPFLPMLPIQILVNNLLYDMSQTMIPTDTMDKEFLSKPRKWEIGNIKRFILTIGPISSVFDYATYFVMLFMFGAINNPALFHTGWFVESLITQTMVIHVIRSRGVPFIQSRASAPLMISTFLVALAGIALPYSPLAERFGFVHLPILYWPILFLIVISYIALTQRVKTWYINKYRYN